MPRWLSVVLTILFVTLFAFVISMIVQLIMSKLFPPPPCKKCNEHERLKALTQAAKRPEQGTSTSSSSSSSPHPSMPDLVPLADEEDI